VCGVFGLTWQRGDVAEACEVGLAELAHRGPDGGRYVVSDGTALGQTRLAVRDLDPRSSCPFVHGRTTLVYNGELWNDREIRATLEADGREFRTTGDTEVVAAALDAWGTDALPLLEGMFALAWTGADGLVRLARDRFGEVPLHVTPLTAAFDFGGSRQSAGWAWASEEKALAAIARALRCDPGVEWVPPGSFVTIDPASGVLETTRWYEPPVAPSPLERPAAAVLLRETLERACLERAVSDVPVCVLLSGGIDSTSITHHLAGVVPGLVAFTATLDPRGPDLKKARLAADALGVELVEVPVPVPTEQDLRSVVRAIEQPFKAQVEIGWACLVLAREMRERGFKVVFSGEGSDELWASYAFTYHAMREPDFDWHEYRRDLFVGQHRKNFARCNKVFMAHGVEARLPFLHTPLVELGLSLREAVVQDSPHAPADRTNRHGPNVPKAIMRAAYGGVLPDEIVRRGKLAFQDGMGLKRAIADSLPDPAGLYRQAYRLLLTKERVT